MAVRDRERSESEQGAKAKPYKTSFRARLGEFDLLENLEKQDGSISQKSPSGGSQSLSEDAALEDRDNVTDIPQRTDHSSFRADDSAGETIPAPLVEEPADEETTRATEDLVLWPPPGESLPAGAATEAVVPAFINARLLQHQREGVRFLYMLYREKRGGILGDDMGLGKTIQTIAFLGAILGKKGGQADYLPKRAEKLVLIVTPTSVLANWKREFEAWGAFRVGIFHGKQREMVLSRIKHGDLEICLTSYQTLVRCIDELQAVDWDCVFVDEAHVLKNNKTDLYGAINRIATPRRFGLTGTVLQNKYKELWCIFQWASENSLGSKDDFREYYEQPLKLGQRITAPHAFRELAKERQAQLLRALRPHFLRRTKDETIGPQMKGKVDNVIFTEMSPLQKRVYKRVLESDDFQLLVRLNEPCDCGSGVIRGNCCHTTAENGILYHYLHEVGDPGPHKCPYCMTLPCLQILLKISNHLELMKPDLRDTPQKQEKDRKFAELALGEDAELIGGIEAEASFMGLSDTQHCGKMRAMEVLLEDWKMQGDKVLLFSHSVRMLDILERLLIRKGYSHLRLDGSTPQSLRQNLCDDFNNSRSRFVFLISTRAGGLGLNLVGANRVVIFDPSWNPSYDLQAQDRSFRYGQTRHVTVYRLMTAGSIEEIVYNRQIYKQQQFHTAMNGPGERRYFEGVMDRKDMQGEIFGIANLFQDLADKVLTSDVLEREERITRVSEDLAVKRREAGRDGGLNPSQTLLDGQDEHGLEELAQLFQAEAAGNTARGLGSELALPTFVPNKARVPEALRGSGVLYAVRNEEVVGAGSTGERARASWAWDDAAQLQAPRVEVRESGARRRLAQLGRAVPAGRRGEEAPAAQNSLPPKRPRFQYAEEHEMPLGQAEEERANSDRSEDNEPTLRVFGGRRGEGGSEEEDEAARVEAPQSSRPPRRPRLQYAEEDECPEGQAEIKRASNDRSGNDEPTLRAIGSSRVESNSEEDSEPPRAEAPQNSRPPKRPRFQYVDTETEERPNEDNMPTLKVGIDRSRDDQPTLRVVGSSMDEMATLRMPAIDEDDVATLRASDAIRAVDEDDVATLRMEGGGLATLEQVYDTQKEDLFREEENQSGATAAVDEGSKVVRKAQTAGATIAVDQVPETGPQNFEKLGGPEAKQATRPSKRSEKDSTREKELVLEEVARMRGTSKQATVEWLRSGGNKAEKSALLGAATRKLKQEGKT